jgi:hypothetical protein
VGNIGLYKVQAGKETTPGTAVAATAIWHSFKLRPVIGDREIVQPEEDRGSLAAFHRGYTVRQLADLGALEANELSYEDAPYLFLMALKGAVTSTQPDPTNAATVRLHTFTPSLSSANTPDTWTVEWGEDTQAWESEYCFLRNLKLTGAANSPIKASGALVGRQNATCSFTGALSARSMVAPAVSNMAKVYFDDAGGTMGNTQLSAAVLDWEWDLGDHFVPVNTQDGNLYFTMVTEQRLKPKLTLTAYLTTAVKTLITTKYAAGTAQLVRLDCLGSLIATTFYTRIRIDGAYRIVKVDAIGERDGGSTVRMELSGEYDATWAKLVEVSVQNTVETMP